MEAQRAFRSYKDFAAAVDDLGFMPLSTNRVSFPSLEGRTNRDMWHTGLETDPWQWKTQIVEEHRCAYAKLFFGKPGFISLKWYPVFLAARRAGQDFGHYYRQGLMSHAASLIYALFDESPVLATHEIKSMTGLGREAKAEYERGMVELQMGMFITIDGMTRMVSATGEPHSWPATSYTAVETWAPELVRESLKLNSDEAAERIIQRVIEVVPEVDRKKVRRFAIG